ncbi:hypothetical protein FACS1894137_18090 [Spirochaetia bacterium]|nr:hypothetical protein FACS1894137_18090 [Spirochaetia bacterium]
MTGGANPPISGRAATGSITVTSEVAGRIIIDGRDTGIRIKAGGRAPVQNVAMGDTNVEISGDDGERYPAAAVVRVPEGKSVHAEIKKPTSGMIWEAADGKVTITGYEGAAKDVLIPAIIGGLPVIGIGGYAFREKALTSVIIPNSVTSIGDSAFSGNQLTSVTIPNSVTSIGVAAFFGNKDLKAITVSAGNRSYIAIDGILFSKDATLLHTVPDGKRLNTYTIPNSVTYIGVFAFSGNQLTSVIIPNSVTSIGGGAFYGNQLTSVTIPNSVTSIDSFAFWYNQLTSVTIPNSVTSIGSFAFSSNQLTSVTIPNSVTSIGSFAFSSNQLTSVTIGSNVALSDSAFYNSFGDYYTSAGKRAGTYHLRNGQWSRQ